MRKALSFLVLSTLLISSTPIKSQETSVIRSTTRRGDGAGYSTRDATVLSMMGWGVGLAVGIALLCGYLEQDTGSAHSDGGQTH